MHILRTRFGKNIVTEFLPPKRMRKKVRVAILLQGAPAVPSQKPLMEFLSSEGFWVFFPRYRGTWESGGEFLKVSPHEDVIKVVDGLYEDFTDTWSGKKFKIKPDEVILIGGSFGGPAALLNANDRRVKKIILVSPVVDWEEDSKVEPMTEFCRFMKEGFGEAYRCERKNIMKLEKGKFYNPMLVAKNTAGEKVLIFHAKDDESVLWRPVEKFAKKSGSKLVLWKRRGHMSMSVLLKPAVWKRVEKFLTK
jgi:esterase/lipase